jgi:DNA repair exonuclease SbcCD ATPase subunit
MVTCELCGKEFKNSQGLRGHKTFVHSITGSKLPSSPVVRLAGDQPVSKLEERLNTLEFITGVRDLDSDALLSDISPLTDKFNQATEQLTKLSDRVSKLSDNVRLIDATDDAQREEFSNWLIDLQKTQNQQAALIKEHSDAFSKNLTLLESRTDQVQKMVEDLVEGLSTVRTKLTTQQSQIEYLSNVARRQPTGDTVTLGLTDGKDHVFRTYKSSLGLTRPHHKDEFLGGEYWVDLSEPDK